MRKLPPSHLSVCCKLLTPCTNTSWSTTSPILARSFPELSVTSSLKRRWRLSLIILWSRAMVEGSQSLLTKLPTTLKTDIRDSPLTRSKHSRSSPWVRSEATDWWNASLRWSSTLSKINYGSGARNHSSTFLRSSGRRNIASITMARDTRPSIVGSSGSTWAYKTRLL